jgi:hypothetical protein
MAGISLSDVLIPKAIAGVAIRQPLIEGRIGNAAQTNIEAFYNVPINDRLRITPIFQVITNRAHQNINGTIFSGTLRTVFFIRPPAKVFTQSFNTKHFKDYLLIIKDWLNRLVNIGYVDRLPTFAEGLF